MGSLCTFLMRLECVLAQLLFQLPIYTFFATYLYQIINSSDDSNLAINSIPAWISFPPSEMRFLHHNLFHFIKKINFNGLRFWMEKSTNFEYLSHFFLLLKSGTTETYNIPICLIYS